MGRNTPKNPDGSHRRYFRVMEDILDDPKLSDVSAEAFRAYIRLLAMLNRMRSATGKITVDKRGICYITERGRVDYAEAILSQLGARSLLAMSKVGPRYDLAVCKWPELNGSGFHSDTDTDTDTDTEEKKEGASGSRAPEDEEGFFPAGYETGANIAPMLKLSARSNAAERAVWLDVKWSEIIAAARVDSGAGGTFRDHVVKIASARWNAYLRERDPQKRELFREASFRQKIANREALDARIQSADVPGGAFDPDDPLSGLRAGVNPYAVRND